MDIKKPQSAAAGSDVRLSLSHVPADFDSDRDLALGPWCFSGEDEKFPNWEDLPFSDAFESNGDLHAAASDCEALAAHTVLRLSHRMNKRHGQDAGLPFWWTLMSRWVFHTVTTTWRHWSHLEKFIRVHGESTLVCPVYANAESVFWNFKDSADFIQRGLLSEKFDFWLWSLCLAGQTPISWKLVPLDHATENERPDTNPLAHSSNIRGFIKSYIPRLRFTDVGDAPDWAIGFFSLYLALMPKRTGQKGFYGEVRENQPSRFPKSYLGFLNTVIEATMPRTLGSDFQTYYETAAALRYVPGRIFVNGSATMNDRANFQIAHAIEAGELVVRTQHGSDYGTMKYANIEAFSEYVDAAFVTWGWKAHNARPGKFLPLPALSLRRMHNSHRQANSEIILVGTKMILRSYRIDHNPQPVQTVRYRQEKLAFIDALDVNARRNLRYRPYNRGKMDLVDGPYISRKAPDIPHIDGALQPALLKCRLLVLDHPGTTLNIAMAANIPTICFWSPDTWLYAAEAEQFFRELGAAGIIHPSGPSAASHLNLIIDDLEDWWAGEEVQTARRSWADQFARTSKNWWRDWAMAMAKL
jgi:putative transferase (TIGR04331 family)